MATALKSLVSYRDCIDRRTLTLREREILDLTVGGKSQEQIAVYLRLTTRQVRRDSQRILEALAAAAEEYREKERNGELRIGKTIQLGSHHAQWRNDKVASKVVRRKGLVTA